MKTKLQKRLAELDQQVAVINKERNAIRSEEAYKEAKGLLGRCFKFRNSFGCSHPGKWWLYVKVVKVESDGGVRVDKFEAASNGRFEANTGVFSMGQREVSGADGYIQISQREYENARAKFLNEVRVALFH
jgi:hypothetical protein